MTFSVGSVSLGVKPDTDGFSKTLSDGIKKQSSAIGTVGKVAGGLLIAGVGTAVVGLGLVIHTGMQEAFAASAGLAQLTAGIKSTGNAAGVSVDELSNLAGTIQNYSGQTDDSIVAAEQLLLTFTSIKNNTPAKIFDQATAAAADMAAKMGGDASSNAILLGKALNDPVRGISALTKVGVSFSAAQKETIASLVATGDVAGAQGVILKELSVEFGGAAKAAGESLPGMVQRGKRAFEDLSQTIVTSILPVLTPVMSGAIDLLQQALPHIQLFATNFSGAITGLKSLIVDGDFTGAFAKAFNVEEDSPVVGFLLGVRDAAMALWDQLKIAFSALGQMFTTLGPILLPVAQRLFDLVQSMSPLQTILPVLVNLFVVDVIPALLSLATWLSKNIDLVVAIAAVALGAVIGIEIYKTALIAIRIATEAWAAAQTILKVVMAATPIGIIIVAISALAAGIIWVATQTTFFQDTWKGAVIVMGAAWNWLWSSVISPVVNFIIAAFIGVGGVMRGAFIGVGNFIIDIFNGVNGAINTVIDGINTALGGIKAISGGSIDLHIGHLPRVPHLAEGGTMLTPGRVLVGERGPEFLDLPTGATVTPLTGGGSSPVFHIYEAVSAQATAMQVQRRQNELAAV